MTFLPTVYNDNTEDNQQKHDKNAPDFAAAVCKFRKLGRDWFALQHFMPQVTRCLVFWDAVVPKTARQAIFFVGGTPIPDNHPNTIQMIQVLKATMNVTTIFAHEQPTWLETHQYRRDYIWVRPLVHVDPIGEHAFQGYAFQNEAQASWIRQQILAYYQIETKATIDHDREQPVVALLDATRLGNVPFLQQEIQKMLSMHRIPIQIIKPSPESSIVDMMQTLATVDILVAPHDTETDNILSQLLWMPTCGGLVEVFPPFYYTPQIHGTLATARGKDHFAYVALYTGQNNVALDWYDEQRGAMHKLAQRQQSRKTTACPNPAILVDSIEQMVKKWQTCRRNRQHMQMESIKGTNVDGTQREPLSLSTINGCLSMVDNPKAQVSQYPSDTKLSQLVNFPYLPDQSASSTMANAVCVFNATEHSDHFPHFAQQVYRCFSFWQHYANLKPFLVFEAIIPDKQKFDFIWTVRRDILRGMFGVQEIHNRNDIPSNSLVVDAPVYQEWDDHPHQGVRFGSPRHAQLWRRTVLHHWNLTKTAEASGGCDKSNPVIAVLDRKEYSHRHILNLEPLVKALSALIDNQPVSIYYFEKRNLRYQVESMANVDILISGHGAQLTNIHYMKPCGGVLEVFPPGYYIPHFFGPLAANAQLQHAFLYTGINLTAEWYETGIRSVQHRTAARSQSDICIPISDTIAAVRSMISKWKECCRINQQEATWVRRERSVETTTESEM